MRLADGRVLAFGGGSTVFIGDPNHPNRQFLATDLFDPATGRWKKGAWQPALAFDPPAVALPDDRVLVLDMALRGAKGSVRLYDAKRDRWTTGRTMHTPRNLAAVGLLPNGKVLAAGGYSSNGHPSNAVEVYDPAHDTWSRAPKLHTARSAASAISLADGRVLVVGGIGQMHGSKPA